MAVSISNPAAALVASIFGGTTVYIYGTGFSSQYSLNQVFFGNIFCDPKNYASSYNQITCDVQGPGTVLNNQNIYVGVSGNGVFNCPNSKSCQLSFTTSATPMIYQVTPGSASASSLINFYGIHRIADLG